MHHWRGYRTRHSFRTGLLVTPQDGDAVAEALLYNRNANWAEWIDTRLDTPGTVFVAVGAGHLAAARVHQPDRQGVIRRAQQFGAAGFIPKSAPAETIGQAVAAVLDGGVWFPAMAPERSESDALLAARLAQLTPQQFRVLLCLADGLLNKQIAYELGLAENTVKVHVTAILKKLACYSRTQAAVLVKSLEAEGMEPD